MCMSSVSSIHYHAKKWSHLHGQEEIVKHLQCMILAIRFNSQIIIVMFIQHNLSVQLSREETMLHALVGPSFLFIMYLALITLLQYT